MSFSIHTIMMLVLSSYLGCKNTAPIAVDTPALHRLTEKQINRSLQDIFDNPDLSLVFLPQEIPKDGFYNQAVMRDATPFLVEAIERGIGTAVAEAVEDGGSWLKCHPDEGGDAVSCGTDALKTILPRAWRRPVTQNEVAWINSAFEDWNQQVGFEGALQLSLSVILQSPDFLYLTEVGDPTTDENGFRRRTEWELASRMSYFLWNTIPDAELRSLARDGTLSDEKVLEQQAKRMMRDERARDAVLEFHRQWLGSSYVSQINPDYTSLGAVILSDDELDYYDYINSEGTVQEFIELDEYWGFVKREIKASYEAEFEMFVNHVVFGSGTLEDLLTDTTGFVSSRTAQFYGVDTEGDSYTYFSPILDNNFDEMSVDMYQVSLPQKQRSGVLTQGAFLAGHSNPNQPSPVLRGVFLRERILCIPTLPPPGDIPPIGETIGGDWTTNRERYSQHTSDPSCAACHQGIDGVGFTFENYDAIGAWRDTDNGAPVDATGELVQTDVDGAVTNAKNLIEMLSTSTQVHDCTAQQLYQYAMHRSPTENDMELMLYLQEEFWDDGGVIPNLFLRMVTSPAFVNMPIPVGGSQ